MDRFKFFLERYKKECILGVALLILLVGGGLYFFTTRRNLSEKNTMYLSKEEPVEKEKEEVNKLEEKKAEQELLHIDIKGEVKRPGVYLASSDMRVMDVIEKAGGLTDSADTKANNLSRKVKDEMVIIIYSKKEVDDFQKTKEKEEELLSNTAKETELFPNDALLKKEDLVDNFTLPEQPKEDSSASNVELENKEDTKENTPPESTSKISINTATLEELMNIKGVGESKAKAIIAYRTEHGNFQKIEDIMQVSGIGEKMFEKIKDFIKV